MVENQDNRDEDRTHSVGDQSSSSGAQKLTRLGEFEIRSTLGVGGMGTVFLAYDESMKRDVALKVLHPSLDISKSSQIRFAREAWIAGQLEHRNIIRVFSRGEKERYSYIAMELADGGSLSSHIKSIRDTTQSDDTVSTTATSEYQHWLLQRFVGLAEALDHIHAKGFIHRDIKPHNILLSGENKQFKLTDFGIAHAQDMTRMTKAGDFIGTIKYMSPELLAAHRAKVDKRTDTYSLGVSLYEALTLKLPFDADTDEGFISEILSGHAIPARRRNKQIPRDLETVLLKAVHHDPDRRYQTATEFAEDLRRIMESRPIRAKREGPVARTFKYVVRNKRVALATLITAALFAIVAVQYNSWKQQEMDKERILRTLKMVYESRTSAFEVDPDWPRLSEILYDHLKTGSVDSLAIWFYRINSLYSFDSPDFCTLGNGRFVMWPHPIRILPEKDFSSDHFAALVSTIETSIEGAGFIDLGSLYQGYGVKRGAGMAIGEYFETLFGKVNGHIAFTVRTITHHYFEAAFYKTIEEVRSIRDHNPNLYSEEPELTITEAGDTLVVTGLNIIFLGPEVVAPPILSSEGLLPAEPVYVDTVVDTLTSFVFEAYPDDFPQQVVCESCRELQERILNFSRMRLVRTSREWSPFTTRFEYRPEDSLSIPVTGDFFVRERAGDDLLLSGQIQITPGQGRLLGSTKDSGKGVTVLTRSIDHSENDFEHLVARGAVEAQLRIVPSITVARLFGDVYEFWGDTLAYDITFQAFDSSNVED